MSFRDTFGDPDPVPARDRRRVAPSSVRKLLYDLMTERARWDEEYNPYEEICNITNEVPSATGAEAEIYLGPAIEALPWEDVYELLADFTVLHGEQIDQVLEDERIAYTYVNGECRELPVGAPDTIEALIVADLAPLDRERRFEGPTADYEKALQALRTTPPQSASAVASALAAAQAMIADLAGTDDSSDGLQRLLGKERLVLAESIDALLRHAATRRDRVDDRREAQYLVRAIGSVMAFLIAADHDGSLPPR
jgi:hypothetical protein